jgi:hypothetical protein
MFRIEGIPHYLHSSELYKSLQEPTHEGEDRGHFDVPDGHLKQDQSVHCELDARHLLATLRYWGVGGVSAAIAVYLMVECRDPNEGERLVAEFGREFPYLEAFSKVVGSGSALDRYRAAVSVGSIEVIEYLRDLNQRETGEDRFPKLVNVAASNLCAVAVLNNQVECLRYLVWADDSNAFNPVEGPMSALIRKKREVESLRPLATAAAAGGNIECLRFLHRRGLSWNAAECSAAAGAGKLECLQYLHGAGCPWDKDTCTAAAAGDHLPCLQYAHEHGCPLDDSGSVAAGAASLACLRYLQEHGTE